MRKSLTRNRISRISQNSPAFLWKGALGSRTSGNGPNTVSGSTASNTRLSIFQASLCSGERNQGVSSSLAGVLRGNTIRGNTTRNSERKMALWEGLWEGFWKTSENLWKLLKTSKNLWKSLRTSKNLWKPLNSSLSEILSETLSEADFPLRTSQACCP